VHGDGLKNLLNIGLLWMRDVLLLRENKKTGIVNVDRLPEIQNMAERHPSSEIYGWIQAVRETLDMIDRNVNQQLALIGLMVRLKMSEHY
jgi:hypothetical protein